mgnify:CR=1 FL=1
MLNEDWTAHDYSDERAPIIELQCVNVNIGTL